MVGSHQHDEHVYGCHHSETPLETYLPHDHNALVCNFGHYAHGKRLLGCHSLRKAYRKQEIQKMVSLLKTELLLWPCENQCNNGTTERSTLFLENWNEVWFIGLVILQWTNY